MRARILVVDDTPDNLDLMEQILEDDYDVTLASSGPECLELAARDPFDLILLDVQMPGMDGYEVLRRLQADERTREIPVIFVTARFRDPDRISTGLDLGAFDYITKPVEDEILLAKVRAVLRIREAEREKARVEAQLRHVHKLEAIGRLAAGIAHEINTPIQFIGDNLRFLEESFGDLVGFAGAVARAAREGRLDAAEVARRADEIELSYLEEEVPQSIRQSIDGVNRVAEIVKAMKRFGHPGGASREEVDINELVRTTAVVSRSEWKYVADLELELHDGLPLVPCRGNDISQVLLNLIVNAAHAIRDKIGERPETKGRIVLRTRLLDQAVEIEVEDSGCGIPEEIRDRVFDPFFTTKEVGKGTGQGLALAHAIVVQQHGGEIGFDSVEGQGTRFRIRLPLEAAGAEAATPEGEPAAEPVA
ncbi:MAG: response regulator [Acidobacteria bacterium]|nr:MAG: response regulator [Acidobacteriota bacterium]